jgi:hypothetical protein
MSEQSTQEPTQKPATLGVTDLVQVAQIIQLATSRGTWKAEELSAVGAVYDKLLAFLEAAGAVINSKQDADETATSGEPSAESQES